MLFILFIRTVWIIFILQIYRFKKYTTIPSTKNYEPDNMVSVSVDQFNTMIKTGKFLFHYKEVGFFFGVRK